MKVKKKTIGFLLTVFCALTLSAQNYAKLPWVSKVGAKSFPSGTKVYWVNATINNKKAIEKNNKT